MRPGRPASFAPDGGGAHSHAPAGYTGGTKASPTYRSMGDHTESIRIEFDPAALPFAKVLDIFWANHSPCSRSSRQYMSAIFTNSDEQLRVAQASKAAYEKTRGVTTTTRIEPAGHWSETAAQVAVSFSRGLPPVRPQPMPKSITRSSTTRTADQKAVGGIEKQQVDAT
jgi:hypothetical protein